MIVHYRIANESRMLLNPRTATSSTSSLMEEVSSPPPPHVQRCIEELRSLGVSVSRSRLYKEVSKARSPKVTLVLDILSQIKHCSSDF